jgi:hypothetical protein
MISVSTREFRESYHRSQNPEIKDISKINQSKTSEDQKKERTHHNEPERQKA